MALPPTSVPLPSGQSPGSPPRVFDRSLARLRLARATASGAETFLLDRVAEDMADRLSAVMRRFETAADLGTAAPGIGRALAGHPAIGRLIAVPPLAAGADPGRPAVVADEEALPFAPGSLDLVVSGLSLQLVNDLPGVLAQLRRALRPDGLFLAALLGAGTLAELRTAFSEAESETMGGASPRVAPFADVRTLGALLQRAGFALPVTDVDKVVVRYASPFGLIADLRRMGAANALVERHRVPLRRATLLRAAEIYAERFSDPDGRIRATFEIVWLSGWVPDASQPQPARPGSARMSLAEALGTKEGSAGLKDRPKGA